MYEMGGGSVMTQAGGSGRQPRRHRDVGGVVMARLVNALRSGFSHSVYLVVQSQRSQKMLHTLLYINP